MKYSKAISEAMRLAKRYGETMIVFSVRRKWWFGWKYYYGDVACFYNYVVNSKQPVMKIMMITANGKPVI